MYKNHKNKYIKYKIKYLELKCKIDYENVRDDTEEIDIQKANYSTGLKCLTIGSKVERLLLRSSFHSHSFTSSTLRQTGNVIYHLQDPSSYSKNESVTHLTPTTLKKSGVWDSLFLLYPLFFRYSSPRSLLLPACTVWIFAVSCASYSIARARRTGVHQAHPPGRRETPRLSQAQHDAFSD